VKALAACAALLAFLAASSGEARRPPLTLRVMTRNLYLGSNLDAIVQAKSSAEALSAVEKGWALVQANDFPLGDLNSRADGSTTPTHANLLAAGFQDAWVEAHPNDVGLTCCHGDELRELGGPSCSRIDYVLVRNGFRAVAAGIVGQNPPDRISGLWGSDHAGVWARLRLR
jgi:endonuclease/exonuclease/phosphatase family metal-dependent hydrolase